MKRNPPLPPDPSSQNLNGIKARHLECTLGPSIGCMKFSILKRVRHRLEPEWEMRRIRWADQRGALCTGFTLVGIKPGRTCYHLMEWQLTLSVSGPLCHYPSGKGPGKWQLMELEGLLFCSK
jgi:hypothetical protein